MLSISEFLQFENPEVLAIAIGVLLFIFTYSVLINRLNKGVSLIIGLVVGLLAGWYLYQQRFFEWEYSLAVLLIIVVGAVVFKIARGFFRFSKFTFK